MRAFQRLRIHLSFPLMVLAVMSALGADQVWELQSKWDANLPLKNPHKGWYHHYPDNHISKYKIARDSDLLDFPGMDHLYIRLAWGYLEPQEGKFNWGVIDQLIEKWTKAGLGISFRISCKETSTDLPEQQFATPRWVKDAGAKGGYYRMGKQAGEDAPWEPNFDDPVFLDKLERFLAAFAARYDGKSWVRYMDVGSIGDWGEGHTWAGSRMKYGFDTRKRHIDMHLRHFKRTQLIISDDFVYEAGDEDARKRLHVYVTTNQIGYRDDSILVDGYFAGHSKTATVRSPEFFASSYLQNPTVLELEHYSGVKRAGNWLADEKSSIKKYGGGKTGPEMFKEALGLLRASYIGYHGDAADWLRDNPELTRELLNKCGYWYFPHEARLIGEWRAGEPCRLAVRWENRGVAPAYEVFRITFRFKSGEAADYTIADSGNRTWLPGEVISQTYEIPIPRGSTTVKMKLRSSSAGQDILLPLRSDLRDAEGFYTIGEARVP